MRALFVLVLLALASCNQKDDRTVLRIQRIFGACEAQFGGNTDIASAEGECGIMTSIINAFAEENPDIDVRVSTVFWPGYDQLTAQLAANDEPDLVTMHGSVIPDYQARGLLEPLTDPLRSVGIEMADLTPAAEAAASVDGVLYGLPIDTWAPLWHVNLNLFREADLVRDGEPILPSNPEELAEQAHQFKERTGKPYFVQATANEYAAFTRNFYTLIKQQGASPFVDGRARFTTPEARRALETFKTIQDAGHSTTGLDYSASVSSFLNGGGGVYLVGTWMVGTFDAASRREGHALSDGYTVVPFPTLFDRRVTFADGHNWVMPRDDDRTAAEHDAAVRFLAFFAKNNIHWSRTGHLPVFQDTIDSEEWRSLPHRANLAGLSQTAEPLPKTVRRQFPIETIVGQEAASAILGNKPVDRALIDMERRVNEILDQL